MPKFYTSIPPDLRDWALAQPLFFTASAPVAGAHINVSPKGLPAATLAVVSPNLVAYVDATGSGCETIAHVYENGRVTLMFCGFGKAPRIMRWFCRGRVVERGTAPSGGGDGEEGEEGEGKKGGGEFEEWVRRMGKREEEVVGARAVIVLDVWKVQTACGFGVPLIGNGTPAEAKPSEDGHTPYEDRPTLGFWAAKNVRDGKLEDYKKSNNVRSLDGLPGLQCARRAKGHALWMDLLEAKARQVMAQKDALIVGVLVGVLLMLVTRTAAHVVRV